MVSRWDWEGRGWVQGRQRPSGLWLSALSLHKTKRAAVSHGQAYEWVGTRRTGAGLKEVLDGMQNLFRYLHNL